MHEEGKRALRFPATSKKVGLSRSTIDRLEKANLFPRRIRLGANSVAWFSDEIDKWLEERTKVDRESCHGK